MTKGRLKVLLGEVSENDYWLIAFLIDNLSLEYDLTRVTGIDALLEAHQTHTDVSEGIYKQADRYDICILDGRLLRALLPLATNQGQGTSEDESGCSFGLKDVFRSLVKSNSEKDTPDPEMVVRTLEGGFRLLAHILIAHLKENNPRTKDRPKCIECGKSGGDGDGGDDLHDYLEHIQDLYDQGFL